MPGVSLRLAGTRPDIAAEQGGTLAAQLRRRRRELDLTRAEAAKRIGVSYKTLMWWELGERSPAVHLYPAVIEYLGSEPWPEPTTLAGALLAERRRRGLGVNEAAPMIGVDEGTWLRWERGEWKPTARTLPRLDGLFGFLTAVRFPDDVR
jgi:transcriptional regulator with XRE-family HTH domain